MNLGGTAEAASATSLLKAAEARRAAREAHLFLDIPGWDGDMIGEYRIIPAKEMTVIAEGVARKFKANGSDPLIGDLEVIIHSCVGLHVNDPETGKRVPIEDEFGHVGYGRIADVLGRDDITSNADAVKYLTGTRNEDGSWETNVTAVNQHAQRIQRWMRDPSKRTVNIEDILSELA